MGLDLMFDVLQLKLIKECVWGCHSLSQSSPFKVPLRPTESARPPPLVNCSVLQLQVILLVCYSVLFGDIIGSHIWLLAAPFSLLAVSLSG